MARHTPRPVEDRRLNSLDVAATTVKVGVGTSTDVHASRAAAEAADEATESFGAEVPNLVVTFLSQDHSDFAEDVAGFLGERYPAAAVIGCTAQAVIGGAR